MKTPWRISIWAELLAEFLATGTMVAFNDGVVGLAVVGLTMSGRTPAIFQGAGDWLIITLGSALAVAMGIYLAGGISGAHMNPAVTLAFALNGTLRWRKVVAYWIAQTLGAFAGAGVVYVDYARAINAWNTTHHIVSRSSAGGLATFSIFATYPASYFHGSLWGPLVDQIIGTFFLVLFILAITDRANRGVPHNQAPLVIGLAVAAIGISFGADAGYAINPARDFGPRVFTWLTGWGRNAFPGPGGYWWVPIVGPFLGGSMAPLIYRTFVAHSIVVRDNASRSVHPTRPAETRRDAAAE